MIIAIHRSSLFLLVCERVHPGAMPSVSQQELKTTQVFPCYSPLLSKSLFCLLAYVARDRTRSKPIMNSTVPSLGMPCHGNSFILEYLGISIVSYFTLPHYLLFVFDFLLFFDPPEMRPIAEAPVSKASTRESVSFFASCTKVSASPPLYS